MMKKPRWMRTTLLLFFLGLMACGKGYESPKHDEVAPQAPTPLELQKPKIRQIGDNYVTVSPSRPVVTPMTISDGENEVQIDYKFVTGRLAVDEFESSFDKKTNELFLKGRLVFSDSKTEKFSMRQKINGRTFMSVEDKSSPLAAVLKAAVKCSTPTCDQFTVDFAYKVESEKSVYVVRVTKAEPLPKSKEEPPQTLNPETPKTETPKTEGSTPESPKPESPKTEAPIVSEDQHEDFDVPEEDALEDALTDDGVSVSPMAFSQLRGNDIAEMFPELQSYKQKADEELAEIKKQGPATKDRPKVKPVETERPRIAQPVQKAGSQVTTKMIGSSKDVPNIAAEIIKSLPPGVGQSVELQTSSGISRKLVNGVNLAPLIADDKKFKVFSGLNIVHPELNNFWGTSELVGTIIRIGQWVREHVGNVELDVGDLSDKDGGVQFSGKSRRQAHASHQHGLDADLGYIFSNSNQTQRLRTATSKTPEFLVDKQWELFKGLFAENTAHLIYVSPEIKRTICRHVKQSGELSQPETADFSKFVLERIKTREFNRRKGVWQVVAGHENHFHLRITCGPEQSCRNAALTTEPCPK